MGVKKGDMVKILVGKDRGKTGKILRIKDGRVWVEGLNMVKRHRKATDKHRQSGIIEKESPMNISNVMYYDENSAKASRLGYRLNKENKKVRYLKRTGEMVA